MLRVSIYRFREYRDICIFLTFHSTRVQSESCASNATNGAEDARSFGFDFREKLSGISAPVYGTVRSPSPKTEIATVASIESRVDFQLAGEPSRDDFETSTRQENQLGLIVPTIITARMREKG